MTGQILVPLRRGDSIADVIPYLEQIAGPGSKIIFLVHYSVEGLDWFQSKSTRSVIKEQKLAATKEAFPALDALRERHVTVAFDIYAGPLRKVVKQYTSRRDIDLLMVVAGRRSLVGRVFQNRLLFLNLSCVSKTASVLLLRPDISDGEQ